MNEIAQQNEFVPYILSVSGTEFSLDTLAEETNPNYLRVIDQSPLEFKRLAKYLIVMAQAIGTSHRNPVTILRNLSQEAMKSVHLAFLITADKETTSEFRIGARVFTHNCNRRIDRSRKSDGVLTLATGPLGDWVSTIIANSTRHQNFYHRLIVNKIQVYLERYLGLALIFDGFRKVELPDKSFVLEPK